MTQNGTVRCGMPQRDQAREVTEICGFHKPNGDEEATLEPPAFGLRPDHGSTRKSQVGRRVWIVYETRPFHSDIFHPLIAHAARKISAIA